MSIENTEQFTETAPEKKPLYPERPSYSAEKKLEDIKEYLSGEREKELLTDDEKTDLIDFEKPFVEKLADIRKVSYGQTSIYTEYFSTNEGQLILQEFGLYPDPNTNFKIDITKHISNLRTLDNKSLRRLVESSLEYHTETMLETLSGHIVEDGSLDIEGLDNPGKLMFIKSPENLTIKIESLRDLKSELEEIRSSLFLTDSFVMEGEETLKESNALIHAKLFRLEKLITKLNELLAETLVAKSILDSESDSTFHKPKIRLDKFRYGVGKMNADDNYDQVDNRLFQQADEIAEAHIEINQKKEAILTEQGLDINKIEAQSVEPEQIKVYIEKVLSNYGLLNENHDDTENASNKWSCSVDARKTSFSINPRTKILSIPNENRSIIDVLTKGAVHEIIHILQRENTATIGIPLYTHPSQMGGDRAEMFQEGGAMYYQDEASKELFGFASPPGPNYLRAMAVKQSGGDYLACVKAYYESSISIKMEQNLTSEKKLNLLKMAIDRAGRLFRNTPDLNNRNKSIPSTKDTVYLEQKAVVEEIMTNHPELRNIILVSGMNLETAKELIKFGLLDLSTLRQPDLSFVKALWEEMKDDYKLDTPTSETTPPPPNN
jgi:hypothetical protein